MKQIKFKLIISLIAVFILTSIVVPPAKANVPYETYTYNYWLDIVQSPHVYIPSEEKKAIDMGTEDFDNPADLFITDQGEVYVADTNNNRIVWFDKDLNFIDEIKGFNNNDTFKQPQGIFVTKDNQLYVADTENQRIVHFDEKRNFVQVIDRPETELISDKTGFRPTKIVVDGAGRIYTLAIGVNSGIVEMHADGTFQGFVGASEVSVNPLSVIWRKYFATKEQKKRMELIIPTEYNNMYLDNKEFIYVTMGNVKAKDFGTDVIRRLNPSGINVIRDFGYGPPIGDYFFKTDGKVTRFTDITVTDYQMYTALDGANGRLFTYDYDGNLLYVFGNNGDRVGNFTTAVAVDQFEDMIYVLDSGKKAIITFKLSDYGNLINSAIKQHYDGKYNEAVETWQEVLKFNANSDMAYIGLGKVLLRNGEYKQAMDYFKLANNRTYYSKAFTFYRRQYLADKFGVIVTTVLVLIVFLSIIRVVINKRRKSKEGGDRA